MRLDPRFRFALYAAFSVLLGTGVGWLLADQMKDASRAGEAWQTAAAYLLMLHGGAAMVALMLLGALVPLHVQRGWRNRINRYTGTGMVSANAILVLTAFGLYYLGSDTFRLWASRLHIGIGLFLPVLFVVHLVIGRQRSHRRSIRGDDPARMTNARMAAVGLIGSIAAVLCCFTPVLTLLLGVVGLSAWIGYLDYVLFPAMLIFAGIVVYALLRRKPA